MAYRTLDIPPVKPENVLPRFEVRNGAILDIAFPCYYLDVIAAHNTNEHDYAGWPSPSKPGNSCQYHFHGRTGEAEWIDFLNPHPIDLTSYYEGYDSAKIIMDDDVSGITSTARLDEVESNVIYVRFKADLDFFEDKPKEYRFTVFIHAPERTYHGIDQQERLDQVIRGMLVVLPGKAS